MKGFAESIAFICLVGFIVWGMVSCYRISGEHSLKMKELEVQELRLKAGK